MQRPWRAGSESPPAASDRPSNINNYNPSTGIWLRLTATRSPRRSGGSVGRRQNDRRGSFARRVRCPSVMKHTPQPFAPAILALFRVDRPPHRPCFGKTAPVIAPPPPVHGPPPRQRPRPRERPPPPPREAPARTTRTTTTRTTAPRACAAGPRPPARPGCGAHSGGCSRPVAEPVASAPTETPLPPAKVAPAPVADGDRAGPASLGRSILPWILAGVGLILAASPSLPSVAAARGCRRVYYEEPVVTEARDRAELRPRRARRARDAARLHRSPLR